MHVRRLLHAFAVEAPQLREHRLDDCSSVQSRVSMAAGPAAKVSSVGVPCSAVRSYQECHQRLSGPCCRMA